MDHAEIEILKTMQRSAADRAEVLSRAVRQNMRHGEFDMVTIAMQEVASAAWGVAGGLAEPAELLTAAEKALAWPARSGKLVLELALDRVAGFYGVR